MSDTVKGPVNDFPKQAPTSYKGGAGKYDGANSQGLPVRSNYGPGAPEKFYDEQPEAPKGND